MSVINQVLSDLEKRGSTSLPGETDIRVVPVRRKWHVLWLVVLGVIFFAAVFLWWGASYQPVVPDITPSISSSVKVEEPVDLPVATVVQDEVRAVSDEAELTTMRMSYQLSFIPKVPPSNQGAVQQVPPVIEDIKITPIAAEIQTGSVDKQMKQVSPQQRAENEFRRATGLLQKGRSYEALDVYRAVVKLDETHEPARQAMAGILLENQRNEDAERVLREGLKINPKSSEFAMLLARLQVERNDLTQAMDTLQKTLPYADQKADYHAFVAAVYQRMGRHKEAITHYQIAVQQVPNSGIWLMGLGISLQAVQRNEDARFVFKRAIESQTLSSELQAFVAQQMKEL